MKMTRILKLLGQIALGAGFAFVLSACSEQAPLQSSGADRDLTVSLGRGGRVRTSDSLISATAPTQSTVETGSMKSRYSRKWDEYNGGKIVLSQGSQFELLYGSLTPPAELQGQDVTINMSVIGDPANNELRFEFGPHGSTFDPPATVWFHYAGSNPQLFYINDDGSYTEQKPDEVDTVNGWLMLKIHHFSRYRVAWAH